MTLDALRQKTELREEPNTMSGGHDAYSSRSAVGAELLGVFVKIW